MMKTMVNYQSVFQLVVGRSRPEDLVRIRDGLRWSAADVHNAFCEPELTAAADAVETAYENWTGERLPPYAG